MFNFQRVLCCQQSLLSPACLLEPEGREILRLPFSLSLSLSLSLLRWLNTIALRTALPIPQCLAVGLAIIQGRTKQLAA